jgi:hypothetical protein
MTIEAVDSSFYRPTLAQARAAKAAGVGMWNVYIATQSNVGLAAPWPKSDVDTVLSVFGGAVAFYSGWDNPSAVRQMAASWGVMPCLDDEPGIRPEGPWVQPNLDIVGGGLYGNHNVFSGRRAAFYILGAYPTSGDSAGASWDSTTRPGGLCGWQWAGSHNAFGGTIDSEWLDDGFLRGVSATSGGDMIAFRPGDGDRHDAVFVTGGGSNFVHAWSNNIDQDVNNVLGEEGFGVPAGKVLVPGTGFVAWDGTGVHMMWGAQATDGTWWYGWGDIDAANRTGWRRWFSFASDVPAAKGDTGPLGPVGPPGTNTDPTAIHHGDSITFNIP